MATFDQLSAEQRAILELVLKQGQSYEDLSEMLNMPTSRVRELGRDALIRLSPVSASAVDSDWRDQLGDYLLNQQSGPDSTATRGHLRRSEESRAWARSVLDSLEQFYDEGSLPEIPSGDGAREPRRARRRQPAPAAESEDAAPGPRPQPSTRALSPEAQRILRNRRVAAGAAIAVVALFALLVWPFSVFSGDDDANGDGDDRRAGRQEAQIEGQIALSPVRGSRGGTSGLVVITRRGGRRTVIVQAQLQPLPDRQAYEVWLYNSPTQARSLGAQVTDRAGAFQGAGALPRDFRRFRFIDISREPLAADGKHSGNSVLRGRLSAIQPPPSGTGQSR